VIQQECQRAIDAEREEEIAKDFHKDVQSILNHMKNTPRPVTAGDIVALAKS
jgi:hypothetical protein